MQSQYWKSSTEKHEALTETSFLRGNWKIPNSKLIDTEPPFQRVDRQNRVGSLISTSKLAKQETFH